MGLSDGKIRLRTSDGKVWELLPERLIQADRDFVQQATAAKSDEASIGFGKPPGGDPRFKSIRFEGRSRCHHPCRTQERWL